MIEVQPDDIELLCVKTWRTAPSQGFRSAGEPYAYAERPDGSLAWTRGGDSGVLPVGEWRRKPALDAES